MRSYRIAPVSALSAALCLCSNVAAFSPMSTQKSSVWQLGSIIRADTDDMLTPEDDIGELAVAMESAIKIKGLVAYKPGSATAEPDDLLRYSKLTKLDSDTAVTSILENVNAKVISKGFGVENYVDPGKTTEKIVFLGPDEAAKDAIATAASAQDAKSLVLNFLGGDDLMLMEVCDAASKLILNMDVPTKTKISFNSLSHNSIPKGTCSVCIVSMGDAPEENDAEKFQGADKSVANGEVYFYRDNWWTTNESDLNKLKA